MQKATASAAGAFLVLLSLTLVGCKKGSGAECNYNRDCQDGLVCMDKPGGGTGCLELDKATAACLASSNCKIAGRCAVSSVAGDTPATCVPKSDEHCKQSSNCKTAGNCTFEAATSTCGK